MVYVKTRALRTATKVIYAGITVALLTLPTAVAIKATKVTAPSVAVSSVQGTPGTTKISAKAVHAKTTAQRTATRTITHVETVIVPVVVRFRTMGPAPSVVARTVRAQPTIRRITVTDQVPVRTAALKTAVH